MVSLLLLFELILFLFFLLHHLLWIFPAKKLTQKTLNGSYHQKNKHKTLPTLLSCFHHLCAVLLSEAWEKLFYLLIISYCYNFHRYYSSDLRSKVVTYRSWFTSLFFTSFKFFRCLKNLSNQSTCKYSNKQSILW